ncbi:MAG: thiamine phosphate synthase [Gemmatimonadales bacterium]|nr:thiamine phosphate synthase [Gemmatimonadales bacterium]NIN10753.1 thiamine phosphate synthase [Gemmatimonadales bacterium]NIQ98983.1 thiamine phosphate synthase [Gemmatimonadales bacterium]NIS63802.1 thiamine phosphate synthase [Gemmatimonadales bacterium]
MKHGLPRLHAVTDDDVLGLSDFASRSRAIALAGDVVIHVRGRSAGGRRLTEAAAAVREAGGTVFINDRADVVKIVGAAGIHLPADGLPTETVRRMLGPDILIGRSTHSPEEGRAAAEAGADYVFLGPIWETTSHPTRQPLGPGAIAAAHPARVIAIGGVTPERARICREAGAHGVAAISALWWAPDPGSAAAEMLVSLGGERG